jgi:ribonuclease inhibitor
MPVTKKIMLNGERVHSLEDFYDELVRRITLPEHFGRNLDALWDSLTSDVEGPFEIIWRRSGLSKKHMGKEFDAVIVLLHDLEAERDDFRLVLEP